MTLSYLLLGLLADAPLSGYDLNKLFETTAAHFWTVEQSQVYRALHRLEADELVKSEIVFQTETPNKRLYHLTAQGRAALKAWVRTPLEDDPPREAWLGQIFFAAEENDTAIVQLLESYAGHLRSTTEDLAALQASLIEHWANKPLPRPLFYRLATLDYGITKHQMDLQWIEQLIAQIRQRNEEHDNSLSRTGD